MSVRWPPQIVFTRGFTPAPGFNAISLHHTRVFGTPYVLNEIVPLRRTQSHQIAIGAKRPLKARALSPISILHTCSEAASCFSRVDYSALKIS